MLAECIEDPESKRMVERLAGNVKSDLMVPPGAVGGQRAGNTAGAQWCAEVNAITHSDFCAVPPRPARQRT